MNTAISPKAVLCCQCGQVSETAQNCPYCGSVAVLNLARILDRPESKAETVEVYDLIDEKWIAMPVEEIKYGNTESVGGRTTARVLKSTASERRKMDLLPYRVK